VIPEEFKEVITGMLLGEAYLHLPAGCTDARIQIRQKDKEFVDFLYGKFQPLGIVGTDPKESSSFNKRTGKSYMAFDFLTFTLPFFTELHKEWYQKVEEKNVKILPSNISELLTPRALAYWLAGDGSFDRSQGSIVIYTNSFSLAEVDF
jgi:hypothetical protein